MKFRHYVHPYKILFLVCLIVLAIISVTACSPSTKTTSETVNLKAGEYWTSPINLKAGDLIEGSFSVSGPTNLNIKFAIQNPSGANVYGPVQYRSYSFSYRAQTDGVHHLYLDNTYSWFEGKIISLSVTCPHR